MQEPNSYVFTSEAQHTKPLGRVVVTKDVNKIMRQVSKQLNDKPNITSQAIVFELVTLFSFGKILKTLNSLNKLLIIES